MVRPEMSAVVPISRVAEQELESHREQQKNTLPRWQQDVIDTRLGIIMAVVRGERTPEEVAAQAGISPKTVKRYLRAFELHGEAGLATQRPGKQRKVQPWDARATEYLQLPSRMNCGEIAANLRVDGFGYVTAAQVRRLRKTLPANFDEASPRKLGAHYYKQNHTPYVIRDWGHVPVGYLYEMDGHTCDFYCVHPKNGGYFRPELTILVDVRSQYIVDFWLGGFENSMDLRWLISRAFYEHDHVCHELHVDPGAIRAKTMTSPTAGYAAKHGFDVHFSLPGNARGKGLIEGEWKIFEGRFGKPMPTYLHNRTDSAMRNFKTKWDKGQVERMSITQLYDLMFERYITPRRGEPRKALGGKSPAELWAELQRNPLIAPLSAVVRPREKRTLRNGRVRLHNRTYELPLPHRARYETREIVVEYDEWHDQEVWCFDREGRYICSAPLIRKRPGIPESRVEERDQKTLEGQKKRLALKAAEAEARARPMTPAAMLDVFEDEVIENETSDAEQVLRSGISFTPSKPRTAHVKSVDKNELAALRAQAEAEERELEEETDTADDRIRWALALEARVAACEELAEEDARRLALYQSSPEYHSRKALLDEFGGDE
jgi:putative transposase